MSTIVAIDIETTGLDPNSDAITEIGAVRFSGSRVVEEWTTLVNPMRPIPSFITQLTGITNEMVRNAPQLHRVIPELAKFIGADPVVGHNVGFDLSFLQKHDILLFNEVLDTYDLASVLLPTASRYNLGALGQALGILLPADHRALDDARVTHALFAKLFDIAMQLPLDLIAEFIRLSEPFDWGARPVLMQALQARSRQPISARRAHGHNHGPLFQVQAEPSAPPLQPVSQPQPLDPDEVAALLEYGGPFAHYFEGYEHRPQQVEMLRAVTTALSEGQHLMVEAGTGTGKSFAYLLPAALFAIQNNTRVIISTNTINLQDQLIKKDIPDLRAALNLDLRAVVMKGRSNYLCPRRLETLRQRGPENVEEMRVLAKVLVWLLTSESGDRSEINLNGPVEREVWMRLSAEDEGCKAETCAGRMGGICPFYRVRQEVQTAHLIIVNHALLLADVATGSRVLPEYDYLIVDEGHHMESATTNALSFKVNFYDLLRMLRELGGSSSGLVGRLTSAVHQEGFSPTELAAFDHSVERATDLLFRLEHYFKNFFDSVAEFMIEQREGQPVNSYGQEERILPASRAQPAWTQVEIAWDEAHDTLSLLNNLLAQIYKGIAESEDLARENFEDTLSEFSSILRRLAETDSNLISLVSSPDPRFIYWAQIPPNNTANLSLQIAPLHIGSLMEKYLWHEKHSVILTSATLTTNEGFDYIRGRLNADEADDLQLGSPFDYESAAMVYLVDDIPEPNNANNYQRAVEQSIIQLARATGGRMLALFTSYAQLRRTSQAISPALASADIVVFEQGEGSSPNALLESFRELERAVLLGTRSFWEGVDIAGEALSVLVIVKLPFDVPSDPIIAARSETFEDPFNEYHLPEAILRFKQGFGRLIRTQSDRGIVALLDKRIITKKYGKTFLESLPECKIKKGPMHDLPPTAARWLNL